MSQTLSTTPWPGLSLAATPIGNLGDLSPRAKEALAAADLILAEDTRRTGLMLSKLGLNAKRMLSFFEHNEACRIPKILEAIRDGQSVVLVSDAGTPLLSDPGFRLVKTCRELGLPVRALPGPSAALSALTVSGIAPMPFTFLGFMPRKKGALRKLLNDFRWLNTTLVIFEHKDRLDSTLKTASEILGPRDLCIARELTKTHEEIILTRLEQWTEPPELLGEITVVIGPPEQGVRSSHQEAAKLLNTKIKQGLRPGEVARQASEELRGWKAKELYELAVTKG